MEEDLITCPFDPNHKIRPSRFENHVIKCRKVGYNFLKLNYLNYLNKIFKALR